MPDSDDIIHLPHHVSQNHPQMPMRDRAAQFAPFAALTDYEAAVRKIVRLTSEKRKLPMQETDALNRCLADLIAEASTCSISESKVRTTGRI